MMLQKEISKKYSCEFCHKRFPTPSKLNRHRLVHSGEKPYNCIICNKGFTQKVHLNTHKKLAHADLPGMDGGGENVILYAGGESIGYEKIVEEGEEEAGGVDVDEVEANYAGSDSDNSLFIHTEGAD